jgi:hypothetical protein
MGVPSLTTRPQSDRQDPSFWRFTGGPEKRLYRYRRAACADFIENAIEDGSL